MFFEILHQEKKVIYLLETYQLTLICRLSKDAQQNLVVNRDTKWDKVTWLRWALPGCERVNHMSSLVLLLPSSHRNCPTINLFYPLHPQPCRASSSVL